MRRSTNRLAWALATWFGCGRVPRAPGTAGTLGAVPLYLLAARGGRTSVALTALATTVVGIWAASIVARDAGLEDPQFVVVDEVAGFLVTMLPARSPSWSAIAVGFVAFRVLDAVKPGPVRHLERLPGGWGIVLDDTAAGIAAACVLAALRAARVLP